MRKFLMAAALIFVGVLAWRVGSLLSSDALGVVVGVIFGVLAGVPAALLVLATTNRARTDNGDYDGHEASAPWRERTPMAYPYQPPVIVVAGSPQAQLPGQQAQPSPYAYNQIGPQGAYPNPDRSPDPSMAPPGRPAAPGRSFKMVGEQEEWVE